MNWRELNRLMERLGPHREDAETVNEAVHVAWVNTTVSDDPEEKEPERALYRLLEALAEAMSR